MTRSFRKGLLLLAAVMALSVLAIPSTATASTWLLIGTEHSLDSPNLGYSAASAGGVVSTCQASTLTTEVRAPSSLTITSATFRGCTASGPVIGDCTATWTGIKLPWNATAVTMTSVHIHGIHISVLFEDMPGRPGSCTNGANGFASTLTGTVAGAQWAGNTLHEILFGNTEGLVAHSVLGNAMPVTLNGTLRDTQQSLTVVG
jgi:hypothetical protein